MKLTIFILFWVTLLILSGCYNQKKARQGHGSVNPFPPGMLGLIISDSSLTTTPRLSIRADSGTIIFSNQDSFLFRPVAILQGRYLYDTIKAKTCKHYAAYTTAAWCPPDFKCNKTTCMSCGYFWY